MRAAKLEELKAEVKIMMENHEHAIECRDSIIQVKASNVAEDLLYGRAM